MSDEPLRVGLDLDGSLESLGNSMDDLADALVAVAGCDLVRFRTRSRARPGEARVAARALWSPWWRRGRGRAIDRMLPRVDVLHVAGLELPPTRGTPLVVSVDDLRPLRGETRDHQRVASLRRALAGGATLVASTRTARHEVLDVLGAPPGRVVVVPPAVPVVAAARDGRDLVVNVTGLVDRFLALAPELALAASRHGARVVAILSASARQRVRAAGLDLVARSREEARDALAGARVVVHLSDGARFPSFAIAALAAGVPTIARSTPINRELLEGAAALIEHDHEWPATLAALLEHEPRRAVLRAAGVDRARDYAPATAARAYAALYGEVVRGWRP